MEVWYAMDFSISLLCKVVVLPLFSMAAIVSSLEEIPYSASTLFIPPQKRIRLPYALEANGRPFPNQNQNHASVILQNAMSP
jgi:hypothetical protein